MFTHKPADNLPYEKAGDDLRSIEDEIPFDIPDSWEWCRVGDLFTNMAGLSYKKDALKDRKSTRLNSSH